MRPVRPLLTITRRDTIGDKTHTASSHHPWRLDDAALMYPAYERCRKAGIRTIHTGRIHTGHIHTGHIHTGHIHTGRFPSSVALRCGYVRKT